MAEFENNRNDINQRVSGHNNQVAGRDIIIHVQDVQGDKPSPDNPHLISCPACERPGIHREADKCPRCMYSFENERLRVKAEERRKREQGLRLLALLGFGVLIGAVFVSQTFNEGILRSLGWGGVIVLTVYAGGLWLWVQISAGMRRWQGKI